MPRPSLGTALALALALAFGSPVAAQQREITIVTPGFLYNGGLDVISKGFEAETGIKVTVQTAPMNRVAPRALEGPTDAMFMPADLMDEVDKAGGMKAGSRRRIGRSYQGLAVRKGGKVPDISTVPKFVAALESANLVLYSNPAGGGSRTAQMIADLLKRPEFARVKSKPSPYGEGGAALARNEGDMAIQNISQILLWDNLVVAGPVPEELGMYIDGVGAVATGSKDPAAAQQFVDYATGKGQFALWWSRGVDPRKGKN